MISKLTRRIGGLLLNRMAKDISDEEVWERVPVKVPRKLFGTGNIHDWDWYFEGKSQVKVESINEIVRWLRSCTYAYDEILFNEKDFWQHPVTFETTRKGDCEDFSLWAWRKLKELGIYAELVVGRAGPLQKQDGGHAWVIFTRNDEKFLMETVNNKWRQMTFPLESIKRKYCPAFSVDTNFQTYRYGGSVEVLRLGLKEKESIPAENSSEIE